jgi:homoserine O-succinyltransferase
MTPAGSCVRTASGILTIGFLNNMPAAAVAATERQFCRLVTTAAGSTPIRLRPFSLNGPDAKYAALDDIWDAGLDGLIVTGTEPRAADLRVEPYWDKLVELFDWAEANAVPTVLSCLAAHAAVLHMDGIARRPLAEKRFGVFEHTKASPDPLLRGVALPAAIPHSRWNELDEDTLVACGYRVLTRSSGAGVDLFVKQRRSLFVHFQGHPEYEPTTLFLEYRRDVRRFLEGARDSYPTPPCGYFDPEMEQLLTAFRARALEERRPELLAEFPCTRDSAPSEAPWREAASAIYRNWLTYVRERND